MKRSRPHSEARPQRPAHLARVPRPRAGGFTLIEVMIVAAIVAILTLIAVPSYQESIRRSNRVEARGTLLGAAQYMERLRSERGAYNPGGVSPTLPTSVRTSPASGAARYNVTVSSVTATTYTLRAAPTGSMTGDVCGNLSLDQTGMRSYDGTGGTDETCLNR